MTRCSILVNYLIVLFHYLSVKEFSMKNGLFAIGSILIAMGLVFSTVGYINLLNENARLTMDDSIRQHQLNLLQDQLREYEFKISSAPTYNQGYKDALVKIQFGTYKDGYEAAQTVYQTGSYENGYHNAIEQFGDGWFGEKTKKQALEKLTTFSE